MEPVIIATDSSMADVCAIQDFSLDMAVGHDKQDFTATFEPVAEVGCGSLLYIDGTEYGGIVDDVTADTESGLVEHHGRTWDGILAAKRIVPPSGSDYRRVDGEANAVLASLVSLLDIGDVFSASTEDSGVTVSNYDFPRFVDAYEGIVGMLASAGARLSIARMGGTTVLSAVPSRVIADEADSDLMDFTVTKAGRCVNHLVCAGEGELQERVVLDLYADADGNVSQTQTFFGRDEITAFYDYNNADAAELLEDGTKKLKEYQTSGGVEVSRVGSGDWAIGDTLTARDNKLGITVSTPIAGKTVSVGASTNWHLQVDYELGEVTRSAPTAAGSGEVSYVHGVKGNAEADYRAGNVNLTVDDIGALAPDGSNVSNPAAFCTAIGLGDIVTDDVSANVSVSSGSYKSIGHVTLTRGVWALIGGITFASNATGRRFVGMHTSADLEPVNAWMRGTSASQMAVNGSSTRMHTSMITYTASNIDIYLTAWQNSGAALNCTGFIRAVKVSSY